MSTEGASVPAARFVEQLNVQIANEFAASQQYLACAVYYDTWTMPQMAGFFYQQALEEREHALMMIQYLLDTDGEIRFDSFSAPLSSFDDVAAPVKLALDQEKRVTAQIYELVRIAREENDYAAEQFLQWFIKEQVEEEASMGALLTVVTRNLERIEFIEEYIARESGSEGADATAPKAAGA